jgi:hypothetical protein
MERTSRVGADVEGLVNRQEGRDGVGDAVVRDGDADRAAVGVEWHLIDFNGKIDKVAFKLGPDQLMPEDRKAARDVINNINK